MAYPSQEVLNKCETFIDLGDKIKLYDRVLLKDGNRASIVEIYEPDKYFIADIDTKDGIVTEDLRVERIEKVLE